MKEQINPPNPVAAAQIVVWQTTLFMIDRVGRLWWKEVIGAQSGSDTPWRQITLPETPE